LLVAESDTEDTEREHTHTQPQTNNTTARAAATTTTEKRSNVSAKRFFLVPNLGLYFEKKRKTEKKLIFVRHFSAKRVLLLVDVLMRTIHTCY
jgi:hypothetical protein